MGQHFGKYQNKKTDRKQINLQQKRDICLSYDYCSAQQIFTKLLTEGKNITKTIFWG